MKVSEAYISLGHLIAINQHLQIGIVEAHALEALVQVTLLS
jgi:hypothetical protein